MRRHEPGYTLAAGSQGDRVKAPRVTLSASAFFSSSLPLSESHTHTYARRLSYSLKRPSFVHLQDADGEVQVLYKWNVNGGVR